VRRADFVILTDGPAAATGAEVDALVGTLSA